MRGPSWTATGSRSRRRRRTSTSTTPTSTRPPRGRRPEISRRGLRRLSPGGGPRSLTTRRLPRPGGVRSPAVNGRDGSGRRPAGSRNRTPGRLLSDPRWRSTVADGRCRQGRQDPRRCRCFSSHQTQLPSRARRLRPAVPVPVWLPAYGLDARRRPARARRHPRTRSHRRAVGAGRRDGAGECRRRRLGGCARSWGKRRWARSRPGAASHLTQQRRPQGVSVCSTWAATRSLAMSPASRRARVWKLTVVGDTPAALAASVEVTPCADASRTAVRVRPSSASSAGCPPPCAGSGGALWSRG